MMTGYEGHRKRLKARFLKGGEKAFPDYELLELVLCGVIPRGDVKPVAKQLLATFGSLSGILQADIEKLKAISGIGESSIIALKAIHEVACRFVKEDINSQPILDSWKGVIEYCRA